MVDTGGPWPVLCCVQFSTASSPAVCCEPPLSPGGQFSQSSASVYQVKSGTEEKREGKDKEREKEKETKNNRREKKTEPKKVRRGKKIKRKLENCKVMYSNLRGLKIKQKSLEEIILEENPTIIALVETGLEDEEKIEFEGYKTYPKNKTTDGKGRGVLIQQSYRT